MQWCEALCAQVASMAQCKKEEVIDRERKPSNNLNKKLAWRQHSPVRHTTPLPPSPLNSPCAGWGPLLGKPAPHIAS